MATDVELSDLRDELAAIKRLLVLVLVREDFTQAQIAAALGVSQSQVSKMFPAGVLASLADTKGR